MVYDESPRASIRRYCLICSSLIIILTSPSPSPKPPVQTQPSPNYNCLAPTNPGGRHGEEHRVVHHVQGEHYHIKVLRVVFFRKVWDTTVYPQAKLKTPEHSSHLINKSSKILYLHCFRVSTDLFSQRLLISINDKRIYPIINRKKLRDYCVPDCQSVSIIIVD